MDTTQAPNSGVSAVPPKEYSLRVVVDFGSTVSAVGWRLFSREAGGKWQIESQYSGEKSSPTIIVEKERNTELNLSNDIFGEDAVRVADQHRAVYTAEFKAGLFSHDSGEKQQAQERTGKYLKYLFDYFSQNTTMTPEMLKAASKELRFTVPVAASLGVRDTLHKQWKKIVPKTWSIHVLDEGNSLVDLAMLRQNSPLRSELQRLAQKQGESSLVLIVDIGGLTADIKLMEMRYDPNPDEQNHQYKFRQMNAWPAPEQCAQPDSLGGGIMLDMALRSYLEQNDLISRDKAELSVGSRGYADFRELKQFLNDQYWRKDSGADALVPPTLSLLGARMGTGKYETLRDDQKLTRELFEQRIACENIRTLNHAIHEVIKGSGVDEKDVDWVFLTGGGCNICFIRDLLLGKTSLPKGETPLALTKIQSEPQMRIFPQQEDDAHTMSCVEGGLLYTGKLILTANARYKMRMQFLAVYRGGAVKQMYEEEIDLTERNDVYPKEIPGKSFRFDYTYHSEMKQIECRLVLLEDEHTDADFNQRKNTVGGKKLGTLMADNAKPLLKNAGIVVAKGIPVVAALLVDNITGNIGYAAAAAKAVKEEIGDSLEPTNFDTTRFFDDTMSGSYRFFISKDGRLTGSVNYESKAIKNTKKPLALTLG